MSGVLSSIIEILVGGIQGIATGIGSGLQSLVKSIFLDGSGTNEDPYILSVYGGIICIFGGIALAIGLSRFIVHWLSSLGN